MQLAPISVVRPVVRASSSSGQESGSRDRGSSKGRSHQRWEIRSDSDEMAESNIGSWILRCRPGRSTLLRRSERVFSCPDMAAIWRENISDISHKTCLTSSDSADWSIESRLRSRAGLGRPRAGGVRRQLRGRSDPRWLW